MASIPTRLVLWDIDRTLLFAGGVDRQAWQDVCVALAGRPPDTMGVTSGRTAPQIILHALTAAGLPLAKAQRLLPEALRLEAELLEQRVTDLRAHGHVMPGVPECLHAVGALVGTVQSVLTGNLKASAMVKLSTFALDGYLDLRVAAFGSDHPHRPALVGIARDRFRLTYGAELPAESIVLIGDSCLDVEAARLTGARCIAVATGRTSAAELEGAGADLVLPDLNAAGALVEAVATLAPTAPALTER